MPVTELLLFAVSQADGGAQPPPGGGFFGAVMPIILIFGVFYFLIIRPQQKRQGEHAKMLDTLKAGDEVVTNGGLVGKVVKTEERLLTIEIADKVKVRVLRGQIAGRLPEVGGGQQA